jgi:hypothetical protein
MPTEDWIQESLARLESLEEERNRHEAALESSTDPAALRMNTQAIERLDAKIRSLYAELEAAAEQGDAEQGDASDADADDTELGDGGDGEDDTAAARRRCSAATTSPPRRCHAHLPETVRQVTRQREDRAGSSSTRRRCTRRGRRCCSRCTAAPLPHRSQSRSHPLAPVSSAPAASPFGGDRCCACCAPTASPFGSPASPFGEVPQARPSATREIRPASRRRRLANSSFDAGNSFDDESSSGSGSKMGIIIAVVVVVIGLGAYLALGGKGDEPPPAAPAGPVKVIGGKEVPPDTQGPKTVQGSSDAIKGTQYKEGRPQTGGGGGGSNNARARRQAGQEGPAHQDRERRRSAGRHRQVESAVLRDSRYCPSGQQERAPFSWRLFSFGAAKQYVVLGEKPVHVTLLHRFDTARDGVMRHVTPPRRSGTASVMLGGEKPCSADAASSSHVASATSRAADLVVRVAVAVARNIDAVSVDATLAPDSPGRTFVSPSSSTDHWRRTVVRVAVGLAGERSARNIGVVLFGATIPRRLGCAGRQRTLVPPATGNDDSEPEFQPSAGCPSCVDGLSRAGSGETSACGGTPAHRPRPPTSAPARAVVAAPAGRGSC